MYSLLNLARAMTGRHCARVCSRRLSSVPLVPEHVDAATDVLASQFCGAEPVTRGCGLSYDDFYPWVRLQCQRSSKQGLSTVCLIDGEIVAAVLSEDLKAPTLPDGDPFYTSPEGSGMAKFAPGAELFKRLHHKLFADHPEWADVKQGVLFHQWMSAVSNKFTHHGLCNKITATNLQQGAARGFTTAVAECTGNFSLAAALKAGYVERHKIMYADFEFNGSKVFANSERDTGHTMCVLCTRDLK